MTILYFFRRVPVLFVYERSVEVALCHVYTNNGIKELIISIYIDAKTPHIILLYQSWHRLASV